MTRREARMIAEELHKLLKEDNPNDDIFYNTRDAASYINKSESYVRHNLQVIPHTKKGGRLAFSKLNLQKYMLDVL